MDQDIQERVQKCNPCQINRKSPEKAPLHPWEYTSSPWIRIHIDYAGPFLGRMFLIIVDSYSKWKEVHISKDSTTKTTIEGLSKSFATHGFPEQIVSENGTSFTSAEYKNFLGKYGIKPIYSAPYHPATNGLAERAVQSLKEAMRKTSNLD